MLSKCKDTNVFPRRPEPHARIVPAGTIRRRLVDARRAGREVPAFERASPGMCPVLIACQVNIR